MDIFLWIPVALGLMVALIINYLADILPYAFKLGRPTCPSEGCGHKYFLKEYIFLFRCQKCGYRSRLRPLIVYLSTIAIAIYLWIYPLENLGFYLSFLIISYLVLVALIDFEHHLILLPLDIAGFIILCGGGLLLHGWWETLLGGVLGAGIMFLLFLFGKLFTRFRAKQLSQPPDSLDDSLAFGDVILFALLGFFLGWSLVWFGLLFGLLLAGLISLVIVLVLLLTKNYKQRVLSVFIPLGPAFIITAILLIFFPTWISSIMS